MNEWNGILLYILGGSGLIAGLIALFKQRKVMKWSNEYQREIESLKGDIHKNNEVMKSSLNMFSQGYNKAQEKRLSAIEEMWANVITIRDYSSKIVTFYTILLPEEYNNESQFHTSIKMHLPSDEELVNFISSMDELEKKRPYLGEKSWALFTIYRAFLGRITIIFKKGAEEGNIKEWHQDKGLMTILGAGLSKKEYEEYKKDKLEELDSLSEAINIIEQKMLSEFNNTITGTYASEEGLQQAKKIK